MSEAQDRYRLIADGFDARVRAVPDGQWGAQSPCEEWKARDVVAHVIGNHRGMIANLRGGEAEPVAEGTDPKMAWSDVYGEMLALTDDGEAMATTVEGPMGSMPFEQLLGRLVSMDVLVHTWDLARAVGGDERLDADAVAHAFEGVKPLDAMIRRPGVFGPKLDPPAGADTQTEFLYFLGRRA